MVRKKLLYIGDCSAGSTSLMRVNALKNMNLFSVEVIDTSIIFNSNNRLFRSLAFRYKIGPAVHSINHYIENVASRNIIELFDLIWIDKGVLIKPKILRLMKKKSPLLIHYTPDPSFYFHQSFLFNQGIKYYDFLITTKSFEVEIYQKQTNKPILLSTQGFDAKLHRPKIDFNEKDIQCCFIGHHEKEREEIIQYVIDNDIQVFLAGIKWDKFAFKNRHKKNLIYGGHSILGEQYVDIISRSYVGFGFLSNWIPEKHTTRTLEIPACGTFLATPKNSEILTIFNGQRQAVLLYNDKEDLLMELRTALNNLKELEIKTKLGMDIVKKGGFSYDDIMKKILIEII
jgi:spore maturation protein CgeB